MAEHDLWKKLTPELLTEDIIVIIEECINCLRGVDESGLFSFNALSENLQNKMIRDPDIFLCCIEVSMYRFLRISIGEEFLWQPLVGGRPQPESVPDSTKTINLIENHQLVCFTATITWIEEPTTITTEILNQCRHCRLTTREILWKGSITTKPTCPDCGMGEWETVTTIINISRNIGVRLHSEYTNDIPSFVTISIIGNNFPKEQLSLGSDIRMVGIKRPSRQLISINCVSWLTINHSCGIFDVPSPDRYESIRRYAISNKEILLSILVNSIAPEVVGCELQKLCILLSLVKPPAVANGGTSYNSGINLLLVGDKSVGKSKLIRSIATLRNKVSFTEGTALKKYSCLQHKESKKRISNGVLNDGRNGFIVVDDINSAVGNAQKLISEEVESAESDVCIIATASPVSQVYNNTKSLRDNNINISPRLLRCFDITLLMLDNRESQMETNLVDLLMDMYTVGKIIKTESNMSQVSANFSQAGDPRVPLSSRLRLEDVRSFDSIPIPLLRQMITVAELNTGTPSLPDELRTLIVRFCKRLNDNKTTSSEPITAKYTSMIVKLCIARSRLDLIPFDTIQKHHVTDILSMLLEIRSQFHIPEVFSSSMTEAPAGNVKASHQLLKALRVYCNKYNKDMLTMEDMKAACLASHIHSDTISAGLRRLNDEGIVIKTASGSYRFVRYDGV